MDRPLPEELLADSPLWTICDGGTLIVAVSGGRDSVALALAAHAVLAAERFTFSCEVAPQLVLWHLDHGMRPDSAADAEFVKALGAKLGAPVIIERADLKQQVDRDGGNVEELARIERYGRLLELCQSPPEGSPVVPPAVAVTAHHLGDQAETVLHHIVRGTHLGGLRGIAPRFEEHVFRPWLNLPPEEIPPYLESHGQDWREDETNADTALTRNLLRHAVLPVIQRINPRAREHIARLARAAADAHALFERELEKLDVNVMTAADLSRLLPVLRAPTGSYDLHFRLDGWDHPDLLSGYVVQQLTKLDIALTHAEHLALGEWSADPLDVLRIRDFSLALPANMCLVIQSSAGPDQQSAPVYIEAPETYSAGDLTATLGQASAKEFQAHLAAPKTPMEQLTDWNAALPIAANSGEEAINWSCFLPASVKLPLSLRAWQEGDRITLTDGGTKKLGDVFTDAKVPQTFRRVWAVLTDADGEVLWLPALADSQAMQFRPPSKPAWLLKLTHSR